MPASISPEHGGAAPSTWVSQYGALIPKYTGPVLDLACGQGRHTRWLLNAGYEVWALDKNPALLAPLQLLGAKVFHVDLEADQAASSADLMTGWPFATRQFAGIVVTNYLHRSLFPRLITSLQDQGVLIYETFAEGNHVYGRPSHPDFLLKPGELLTLCTGNADSTTNGGLHCIAYQHGYLSEPKEAIVQRLCARRTGVIEAAHDRLPICR